MSAKPRLEMRGVTKRFGSVVALDGIDLTIGEGEVHALVGENGAGKSTLMKVLSGAYTPDAGAMSFEGAPYAPNRPAEALERGVAMVYQELNLAPDLTVAQNLVLGRETARVGWLSQRADSSRVERVLEIIDHTDVSPERKVRDLGPGARQLVEIGRALIGHAKLVVLDEPTSSLSAAETETLYEVIRRLRERGVSIVYISHFLEEVKRIAHRFTVLRDGRTVCSGDVAETSISEMVEAMVGRDLDETYPRGEREPGEVVVSLAGLSGETLPDDASLELRAGEVFGVAGLVGAGRSELLRALFGLEPMRTGRVVIAGVPDLGRRRHGPRRRIEQGLGMVSEDRKEEGLALGRSISENLTLSNLGAVSRFGWLATARRREVARRWIEKLGIKSRAPDQPTEELSGGNQQKIAIARLLHQDAHVLLLDEPTRGIDIGSKVEIYRLISELAAKGKAVLVVSSYLPELLGICDRIAVMHRGVLGEARPVAEWTEVALLGEATRGAAEGP